MNENKELTDKVTISGRDISLVPGRYQLRIGQSVILDWLHFGAEFPEHKLYNCEAWEYKGACDNCDVEFNGQPFFFPHGYREYHHMSIPGQIDAVALVSR